MNTLIIMNVRRPATLILTALLFAPLATLHAAEKHPGQGTLYETIKFDPASAEKMKWWEDAKFGLFVHWGVYSVPGGIWSKDNTFKSRFDGNTDNWVEVKGYAEQILKGAEMPMSEYEKIAGIFDWSQFNAQDYINLCFASGQRYIVITSKHHDGFAIWRSKESKWNIGDATPYGRQSGRDPLKELADACHATKTNGSPWEIKLCFYHSHCADWAEEDASQIGYLGRKEPTPEVFQHYLDRKVKPQVTELLTHYGEIGMIWFDVPRVITVEQVQQLKDLVHKLSPDTIIDGRIGRDMGNYCNTGDNGIVGVPVDVPWETGSSINESYGYKINAQEYKTSEEIIGKIVQAVAHGGNYLLNVGPKGDGTIPERDRQILAAVGKWTKANGEAIFGTRHTPYVGDRSFAPEWGTCTQKDGNLYLFVTRWPKDNTIVVPLLQNRIKRISLLADALRQPLPYQRSQDAYGNDTVVIRVPLAPPPQVATVIAVECEGDSLELKPFKTAYDAGRKEIFLAAANFQAHASSVKTLSLYYDRDAKAIVNWRNNRGGGATVAWTCEVPETGEYAVTLDYSLARVHAGAPVAVLVHGRKQFEFKTASTGGYDRYQNVAIGTVNLEKGRQDFALAPVKANDGRVLLMQLRGVCLTKR